MPRLTQDPISAVQGAAVIGIPWVTGRFYGSPISGNAALTALRIYAWPYWVPNAKTIDRIGINVSAGVAASAARCLLYADDGAGNPSALLQDPGSDLTTTGTGVLTHTVSWALSRGMVWMACMTNSTGTITVSQPHVLATGTNLIGNSNVNTSELSLIGTIGSFVVPNPFPTPSVSTVGVAMRMRST